MTMEETERKHFQGVKCLHCEAPIAVPAVVGHTGATSHGAEFSAGHSQVFTVRCPACGKEKPYRTREIVDFEGSVRRFWPGEIGKSAKA